MKPIPQRTYTRNGTIFKTVDGVRFRFGLRMKSYFKFSLDIDRKDFIRALLDFRYKEQLRLFELSGYLYTKEIETIGYMEDDFIHNLQTVGIRWLRLSEGVNILNT